LLSDAGLDHYPEMVPNRQVTRKYCINDFFFLWVEIPIFFHLINSTNYNSFITETLKTGHVLFDSKFIRITAGWKNTFFERMNGVKNYLPI